MIRKIAATVATLLIGLAGGGLFFWADLPLPWMLGSMLATTVASMAGARLSMPRFLRPPMLAVLGVLLGSSFDASVVDGLLTWIPTIASLPFYVVIIGGASILYLRFVNRYDWRTAFFSGTPGGLGEMILLGEQSGGDSRRIALVHSVRVMLIVFCVPFLVDWFDIAAPVAAAGAAPHIAGPLGQLLLLLCAIIGGLGGSKLGLPAASLIGPMILSAAVHLAGLVDGMPPAVAVSAAQLVIGSAIGVRFSGFRFYEVLATIAVGVGLTAFMFAIATALGLAMHLLTGVPTMLLFLAYTPGGLAEMSLISFALGLDPAFVTTHHIIRIALVVAMAPAIFRLVEKRWGGAGKTNR